MSKNSYDVPTFLHLKAAPEPTDLLGTARSLVTSPETIERKFGGKWYMTVSRDRLHLLRRVAWGHGRAIMIERAEGN